MQTKKQWIEPVIEVVALEAEEDVLALCYTASMGSRNSPVQNCRNGRCATYP
ncbi:MAG: hypothetical protein ACYC63_21390 [Armatimonadota bacterium]